MRELFSIVIQSAKDTLPLHSFAQAVKSLEGLLSEIDREVGRDSKPLRWAITKLSMSSPATVGIGILEPPRLVPTSQLHRITELTIGGFRQIRRAQTVPVGWSSKALERGKELCSLIDDHNLTEIAIVNGGQSVELRADVREHIRILVDKLRETKDSEGTVDGMLELIDVHEGLQVGIYRRLDNLLVKAKFEDTQSIRRQVMKLLGHRVQATGLLRHKRGGEPKEITVRTIQQVRGGEKSALADLYGSDPEFTGGLSVDEFLRRQRGD